MSIHEYLMSFYHKVMCVEKVWMYRTSPDGDWQTVPQSRIDAYYRECT